MPVLLLAGYGPGNSRAIARKFGSEGYALALVGRNPDRLTTAVSDLAGEGITAHAFVGDISNQDALRTTVKQVRDQLGPISSVAFTAFQHVEIPDVLTTRLDEVEQVFRLGVTGLLTLVQAVRDDVTAAGGSILVVNGAFGLHDQQVDAYATAVGADGVGLECAAKSKLVGLLAEHLRPGGVYVGEVIINGSVKGTPHAADTAIDPAHIAERLWTMSTERTEVRTLIAK